MNPATRRDGFSLPISLVIVLIAGLLAAAAYSLMRAQTRETLYQSRLAQAQAIAEAGLEDALLQLSKNLSWKTGFSQKAFVGGYYTVTVSTDDTNPWVESTGYGPAITGFGRAARTVRAQANIEGFTNFASTFTVNWAMTAFDSSIDRTPTCQISNMAANGCSFGADVFANNTIVTAAGAVRINGNAHYANPASTAPAASTVSGTISVAASSSTVDIVDGSAFLANNDNEGVNRIVPSAAYSTTTMILTVSPATDDSNGRVTLSSGTYYFKGINVTSSSLRIDLNTSDEIATIYLAGRLFVSPKGGIDSNDHCTVNGGGCKAYNVHIYGQGGSTMTLSGYDNTGYGAGNTDNLTYLDLYCPEDAVTINQRLLGRAVGKTVTITNPYGGSNKRPIFFFDRQFGYSQATGAKWVSGSWSKSYIKN